MHISDERWNLIKNFMKIQETECWTLRRISFAQFLHHDAQIPIAFGEWKFVKKFFDFIKELLIKLGRNVSLSLKSLKRLDQRRQEVTTNFSQHFNRRLWKVFWTPPPMKEMLKSFKDDKAQRNCCFKYSNFFMIHFAKVLRLKEHSRSSNRDQTVSTTLDAAFHSIWTFGNPTFSANPTVKLLNWSTARHHHKS